MNPSHLFRRPTSFLGVLRIIGLVLAGIILAALVAFLLGYFIMLLWNWLMPSIFGLGLITFWQAFGLALLARLLFGHFGGEHKEKKDRRDKCGPPHKKDFKKWKHFEEFWDDKGKTAFDDYIANREVEPEEAGS